VIGIVRDPETDDHWHARCSRNASPRLGCSEHQVRVHGDHFTPVPVPGAAPATPTRTVAALVDAARARATALGLAGDPLLPVLAVLAAGAALVQITGHPAPPDLSRLARRCAQERVTATVDTPVDGIRTLP
jgi:hypothetical protein